MAKTKTVTPRYLQAVFKRGQAECLPLSYFIQQGESVLAPGETDKIETVLGEMVQAGEVELKDDKYRLLAQA